MNIAVLIKHVPVSNDVSVDPETHALIRSNSEGMINPSDLNAVEAALQIKEKDGSEITVFTMGPPDAEKSLRDALALGCDRAVLVSAREFAGADTVATARVLGEALGKGKSFDLILAGSMSSDGATGQVGAMVAEYMDIPHISECSGIDITSIDSQSVEVLKTLYSSEFRIKSQLPCLITVNFGINEPRLATLRSRRAAKAKPLEIFGVREINLPSEKTGIKGSPTMVTDSFEPETGRRAKMIEGTPKEIAVKIKSLIEEERAKN